MQSVFGRSGCGGGAVVGLSRNQSSYRPPKSAHPADLSRFFAQAFTDFPCFSQASVLKVRGMGDQVKTFTATEWAQNLAAARSRKLSPERRKEIAKLAAEARWRKKNGGDNGGGGGSPEGTGGEQRPIIASIMSTRRRPPHRSERPRVANAA